MFGIISQRKNPSNFWERKIQKEKGEWRKLPHLEHIWWNLSCGPVQHQCADQKGVFSVCPLWSWPSVPVPCFTAQQYACPRHNNILCMETVPAHSTAIIQIWENTGALCFQTLCRRQAEAKSPYLCVMGPQNPWFLLLLSLAASFHSISLDRKCLCTTFSLCRII